MVKRELLFVAPDMAVSCRTSAGYPVAVRSVDKAAVIRHLWFSPVVHTFPRGQEAASSGGEEEEEWKAPAAAATANDSEDSDEEKPKPTEEKKPKEKKAKKAGKKPGDGSGVSNKIEVSSTYCFCI